MGYGMAFGMAAGLFDLSTGSRVIVAASVGGFFAQRFGLAGLIFGSLIGGILVGVMMGIAFDKLRIPSLVLSLGMVMLLEVLCYGFLGTNSFIQISNETAVLGKTLYSFLICLVLAAVFYILYYKTRFSYHVRTVGNNELLAKNMGISPKYVNFMTFVIGGIFIGIVGILQISYSNSIGGGISMIFTGLIALGLPSTMQDVVLGLFMIIVMAVSANRTTLKAFIRRRRVRPASL